VSVEDRARPVAASPLPEEAAGAYLRAVARHWWVVILATGITVWVALFTLSQRADTYETSASVYVSPVPQGDPTFTGTGVVIDTGDPVRTVQTAAALLDSPEAAAAAATEMGPGWNRQRVQGAVSITPRGQSNVLAVTAGASTRADAARLANAFADAAVAHRARIVHRNIASVLGGLQARASRLQGTAPVSSQLQDLTTRITTLRSVQAGKDPTLSVDQSAQVPGAPTGAPRWLVALLAGVVGFALGCIAALATDFFSGTVRDESEVERLFPVPILAAIPKVQVPSAQRRSGISPMSMSPIAFEQIRLLRAQLRNLGETLDPITREIAKMSTPAIMVTSPSVGDGKTTIAAALAAAFAEGEQDVVVLDLDLRDPGVGRIFGLDGSAVEQRPIDWNGSLSKMLRSVPGFPHIKVLPTQRGDISTLESLIGSLPDLLTQAKRIADWVIVDTAPLGEVSDAIRIAGECDEVLVVVRPGHTDRAKLVVVQSLLARIGATPVGTVLVGQRKARSGGPYRDAYAMKGGGSDARIRHTRRPAAGATPVSGSGD
jgi:tyrosine-protein kinase